MTTTTRHTRPPKQKPAYGPPRIVPSAPPGSTRTDIRLLDQQPVGDGQAAGRDLDRRHPDDGPSEDHALRVRPTSGSLRARSRRLTRYRPRWLPAWTGEILLVLVVYFVYDGTRDLRTGSVAVANDNGERFLRWERDLHLSPEHWLNQLLWHHPVLAVPSAYFYASLHFIVTPAVLIWLYRRHHDRYRSARTALFAGTLLALVIYWLVPTTPPRLLPGGAFHDILVQVHQWGWWSAQGSAPKGLGSLDNVYAAMPSLHVGWALWSGWLIARHARHRSVRILGAAYPIVTALVVMGTGNHYLLDALGGVVIIAIGAGLSLWIERRRSAGRVPSRQHRRAPSSRNPVQPPGVAAAPMS